MPLGKPFYERDPAAVARELLGRVLVVDREAECSGAIVETEAYYGLSDPASRAARGKTKLSRWMWEDAGTSFVYMVHGHWLFNVITERRGKPSGVLIRAVEPREGVEEMRRRRQTDRETNLTSGPGKLTRALGITGRDNGIAVYLPRSSIRIEEGERAENVATSHRIGVRSDLPEHLRFFIPGNPFVSR
ncbi:MAG TPA: DNA-3-methyladenine glycosylase [Thermoplasmatales archaeon]|nr:DNA-3-methyladenine glycosylase [Thermoplasmatales archaeon]